MNAVTHFHFSLWGDYSVVPVEDRQRLYFCSRPRTSRRTQAIPASSTLISDVWQQGVTGVQCAAFSL
jgi:hypothetical protein